MYQQNIPYDDINRRSLVPTEAIQNAIPILNVDTMNTKWKRTNLVPPKERQLATDSEI
jgi:hypothetical protein